MKTIAAILVLGAAVACAQPTCPPFKVELRKAADRAVTTSAHESGVVTITSDSGIGGAKLVRTGAGWPARLAILLNLKGLESLRMENGVIRVETALKGPRQVPCRRIGKDDAQPAAPGRTLEVILRQTGEAVEILVPKELMDANPKELTIEWIDFFRG